MRVAIYYTPAADDPLVEAAANWLGRNAFWGAVPRTADPEWGQLVSEPRRYGFHANLKGPSYLVPDLALADLESAVSSLAGRLQPLDLGRLRLSWIDSFLTLTSPEAKPALFTLETAICQSLDPFRAPLSEAEKERKSSPGLTPSQRQRLVTSRSLDALAIFIEDAPGAPFRVHALLPLQIFPQPAPSS